MANFEQKVSWGSAVLAGVLCIGAASPAVAFPGGIASQSLGPQGCNACHVGGQTPTVALTGPTTVDPSSTNEYTLSISVVGAQNFGGLNVAAPFGTFAVGGSNSSQTQLIPGAGGRFEVTHLSPKAASGAAILFSFLWTAPDSFTDVTFSAWGNAVNHNGDRTGDQAAFTMLAVNSSMPGPNPTMTSTATPAATPTPVIHDAVVAPVKPLNLTLAAGASTVLKTFSVKVINADPKTQLQGQVVALTATSDCPVGVSVSGPSFSGQGTAFLKAGQARAAKFAVSVSSDAFTTLNHKAAGRCTLTFVVGTSPPSLDPNPSNNRVTASLNVVDKNDPEQATVDESFIQSLVPLKVTIPLLAASGVKTVKPAVGNADILPSPENPGDAISIIASDGDCPAGTVGTVTPPVLTVKGGKKQKAALSVTIDAAQFASPNAKSPARCIAQITAAGPTTPDADATNNATDLVIDVIDKNDF
jgi:hypothetical protein